MYLRNFHRYQLGTSWPVSGLSAGATISRFTSSKNCLNATVKYINTWVMDQDSTDPPPSIKILGIETSCDDTGAAVVTDQKKILGESLYNQSSIHNQ